MRYGLTDEQIDIPQQVLDALAEGKLALFAGSGVSRDAPSSYPDFAGLAEEAKEAFQFKAKGDMPIDQYFGQLDRAYPKCLHEWIRHDFKARFSPNSNHMTLLRLFHQPEQVRIVTTNFAAISRLWRTKISPIVRLRRVSRAGAAGGVISAGWSICMGR